MRAIMLPPGPMILRLIQRKHSAPLAEAAPCFERPGCQAADDLLAMVTHPGFEGCFDCRWLPRGTTSAQPSPSSTSMTSRAFTGATVLAHGRSGSQKPNGPGDHAEVALIVSSMSLRI